MSNNNLLAGYTYTTGTTSVTTPPTYIISNGTNGTYNDAFTISQNLNGNTLHIKGDANFEGDIKIKGKSLSERLDGIEQRLAILHPNKKLEQKWERLKALGDMYRELEQEILEKEHIWASLKK